MSDNNNNATSSPTATPNKCQELEPGDITIFLLNSDILDTFVFFPLVDIYPEVGSLYVTDNAWTGKEFLKEEGTVQLVVPPEGFPAGDYFGYGDEDVIPYGDNWTRPVFEPLSSLFDISAFGDQILLYCFASNGEPHFIWGFSFNGPWNVQGLNATDYGSNTSALPDELMAHGNIALPHCDNYLWRDPTPDVLVNKTVQRSKFMDPTNYQCDDENPFQLQPSSAIAIPAPWFVGVSTLVLMTWRL